MTSTIAANATAFSVRSVGVVKTTTLMSYTRQTYYELARAMKDEITVKDRSYLLKTYNQCFLGSDAVGFIQRYLELESREDAVEVGREMNGKIHCWEHVCREHKLKDEILFFRFTDSSKSQKGCLAELMKSRTIGQLMKEVDVALKTEQTNENVREQPLSPVVRSRARPIPRPGINSPRRRERGGSRSRSPRSKSPRKTGLDREIPRSNTIDGQRPRKTDSDQDMQRSYTFDGQGSGDKARKQLQVARPGMKRMNALRKKQEIPRKIGTELANPEVMEEELSLPREEHSASVKTDDENHVAANHFRTKNVDTDRVLPIPFGLLLFGLVPPRPSSAPNSPRRSPPGKGRTQQTKVKKVEDMEFLQKGHASWAPDSDQFLLPLEDEEDDQGHSSCNALSCVEAAPKARASLDKKAKFTAALKTRTSLDKKAKASVEATRSRSASREKLPKSRQESKDRSAHGSGSPKPRASRKSRSRTSQESPKARRSAENKEQVTSNGSRSALLTSLYCDSPKKTTADNGSSHSTRSHGSPVMEKQNSLMDLAFFPAERRPSLEAKGSLHSNASSAFNDSILGDLDDDFDSGEFAA